MTKLPLFKIRASQVGQIMTSPRSKADKEAGLLSKTTETYVDIWIKEQLYDRKKPLDNKYLEKGITVEDDSIDYIAKELKYTGIKKNEESFENDWMTGTPDVIKSKLIDVKNNWDCFSFPLHDTKVPKPIYEWQLLAYMDLTGDKYKEGELIYILMDTPESIIQTEFKYHNEEGLGWEEFQKLYQYNTFSADLRIKKFIVTRDEDKIQSIKDRVLQVREYIKTLGYEQ